MPLQAAFTPLDAGDDTHPVNPKLLPEPCFVAKTHAVVGGQKWFLNCCSHMTVSLPLSNGSNDQVDEAYLDAWCLSNVQVPIHVCSKRICPDHAGQDSVAVDVVFNPALTQRARAGRQTAAFREHMCQLALSNAEKEFGVRLDSAYKVIKASYKGGSGDGSAPLPIPELVEMEKQQALRADREHAVEAAPPKKKLVHEFDSWEEADRAASEARQEKSAAQRGGNKLSEGGRSLDPAVNGQARHEEDARGTMKKGFLSDVGGKLYPNGSTEGTPAPGAGDPMGWMPEKLRSRVKMVDTATTSQEEQEQMMRVHAGLEDPKAMKHKQARAKSEEEQELLKKARDIMPTGEEMEKIAAETDPEEFLNELRVMSDLMDRKADNKSLDYGVEFAKQGFLKGGSSGTHDDLQAATDASPVTAVNATVPEYSVEDLGDSLQLVVKLPHLSDSTAVEVDLSASLVIVRAPGSAELRLDLPRRVDDEAASAGKFRKKKRELKLTLPVVP